MKTAIILASGVLLFAVSSFAIEDAPPPKGPGPNFEQHKADIIKRIDGRIARNQEEKSCIQAARNLEDVKACRDKFRAEIQEQRQNMRK